MIELIISPRLAMLAVGCALTACHYETDADPEATTEAASSSVSVTIDVPWIAQKPELPRGCEVTSLAMVLEHAGVTVDKLTLADQVTKVPYTAGGLQGDPYVGFVGNMVDLRQQGYGVYHAPIKALAEKYLPGRVIDVTGGAFDDLLAQHVGAKRPLWVIVNATFKPLSPGQFQTWQTASGPVGITWHEHSVVVTGFDEASVTINDPLDARGKNKKVARADFRVAWEQMGSQAITILPPPRSNEPALPEQILGACDALAVPLAPNRVPSSNAPFALTTSRAIALADLRPGDALNRNVASSAARHLAVFAGWADAAHSAACVTHDDGTSAFRTLRAYDRAALSSTTPVRFASPPGGLRSDAIGPGCTVHGDGRLHCSNDAGAPLLASRSVTASTVNHLRTTYSWFDCWASGEQHAGGNTTWYHTLGDDNATMGWVAAVHLGTRDDFDTDPSARGLRRCAP